MSSGHIEYASFEGTHVFKLVGEVRATSCLGFETLLNKLDVLAEQDPRNAITGALVDLNEATFIDSTALGLLAKLGLKFSRQFGIQALMLSTKPELTTLAKSMGLSKFYVMLNCKADSSSCSLSLPDATDGNTQTIPTVDQHKMLDTVLDAHRTLMNLTLSNKSKFETIVTQLEKVAQQESQKISTPQLH